MLVEDFLLPGAWSYPAINLPKAEQAPQPRPSFNLHNIHSYLGRYCESHMRLYNRAFSLLKPFPPIHTSKMSTFTLPNTSVSVQLCEDLTKEELLEFPAFKVLSLLPHLLTQYLTAI